jgi:alkylated DNA repair dioxygenase AlkB
MAYDCYGRGMRLDVDAIGWEMTMRPQRKVCHEIAVPPGLKMAYEVISTNEEEALIAEIEAMDLPPFVHDPGNPRCTRTFGWDYGWPDEAISVCEPIPPSLHAVRDLAAELAEVDPDQLIQGQIIRYEPGAIIQHHCDKRVWDHVIGLSLGDPVTMEFRKALDDGGYQLVFAELPPRSIYVLTGEARHLFEHGLPAMQGTRWSITFRDFSPIGMKLRDEVLSMS